MSSFDTPDILMPLDEYYAQCVEPKPMIPKRYGFNVDKKQRQAARLQSYKDNPADENEIEDDEEEEQGDELNSSIQESNMNQISFETNDFNQLYEEVEEQMDINNAAVEPQTNIPASSAQWRIKRMNLNRPQGAPPLIPRDAPRNQPRSRIGGGRHQNKYQNKRRFHRNNNNNNYNNNNNNRYRNNSVHNRLGYNPNRNQQRGRKATDLRLRNAYMGFKDTQGNNNTKQQQQQVLMNINGHFQSTRSQLNVSSSLNSNDNLNANGANNLNNNYFQSYKKQANANWQLGSNSLADLINSSNQIRPSTEMQNNIMSNNFANNNILNNNTNNMTNINHATRLDANLRTNLTMPQSNNAYNVAFGQPMNQLNSLSYRGSNGIVASDSLRLADLMNMDANSCANLNVAEVAKNAMMLLSTVFHKPILDEDVQQELSHIQKNNGLPEEPDGVDLNINPETTELRMYHRFK